MGSLFDLYINDILDHEGWNKFTEIKDRNGNVIDPATKFGITWNTIKAMQFDSNQDGVVDKADVRDLTLDQAKEIYRERYWLEPMTDVGICLPKAAVKMFDIGINAGPCVGYKILQRALNIMGSTLAVDGKIGPNTLKQCQAIANLHEEDALLNAMCDTQLQFYTSIVRQHPEKSVFMRGWENRSKYIPGYKLDVSEFTAEELVELNMSEHADLSSFDLEPTA